MNKPDYAPTGARLLTLGVLAEQHEDIKPKTRSRVRVAFNYLKFTPHGEIKSVSPGALTLIQGKRHPKQYPFDGSGTLNPNTPCWVWTLDDERAENLAA